MDANQQHGGGIDHSHVPGFGVIPAGSGSATPMPGLCVRRAGRPCDPLGNCWMLAAISGGSSPLTGLHEPHESFTMSGRPRHHLPPRRGHRLRRTASPPSIPRGLGIVGGGLGRDDRWRTEYYQGAGRCRVGCAHTDNRGRQHPGLDSLVDLWRRNELLHRGRFLFLTPASFDQLRRDLVESGGRSDRWRKHSTSIRFGSSTGFRTISNLSSRTAPAQATSSQSWAPADAFVADAEHAGLRTWLDLSDFKNLLLNTCTNPYGLSIRHGTHTFDSPPSGSTPSPASPAAAIRASCGSASRASPTSRHPGVRGEPGGMAFGLRERPALLHCRPDQLLRPRRDDLEAVFDEAHHGWGDRLFERVRANNGIDYQAIFANPDNDICGFKTYGGMEAWLATGLSFVRGPCTNRRSTWNGVTSRGWATQHGLLTSRCNSPTTPRAALPETSIGMLATRAHRQRLTSTTAGSLLDLRHHRPNRALAPESEW